MQGFGSSLDLSGIGREIKNSWAVGQCLRVNLLVPRYMKPMPVQPPVSQIVALGDVNVSLGSLCRSGVGCLPVWGLGSGVGEL
jgi:hypothetical protein